MVDLHDENIKYLLTGAGIMELLLFFCGIAGSRAAGMESSILVFAIIYVMLSFYLALWMFLFLRKQGRQIDEASEALEAFMKGDVESRLYAEREGKMSLLFSGINDLMTSQQAHVEKEKKAKLFLQDMISDISHQIKTPLAALKMYHEIISGEPEDAGTVAEFSARAELSIERMEGLVKNLLKLAKLDAGTILFQKETVKVKPLMERLKAEYETRAEREGKKIVLKGSGETKLCCDRGWMAEAVGNLLKNALDHTGRGGEIMQNIRSRGTKGGGVKECFFYDGKRRICGSGRGIRFRQEYAAKCGGSAGYADLRRGQDRRQGGIFHERGGTDDFQKTEHRLYLSVI